MSSPCLVFIFIFIFTISSSSSTLDPKQLTALQSIGLPLSTPNPCNASTSHIFTLCDSFSSPFRHLTSLTLSNCSSSLFLSSTALHSLFSSLLSLSFLHCPHLSLPHLPPSLPFPLPLQSLSSLSSLSHLSAIWLSRLHNLTHLSLISTPITTSAGPVVFFSQMPHLLTAIISDCNLTGRIPHHWHSLNLTHLDLSSNRLAGSIPTSISLLSSLQFLNLTSNSLFGTLPISIGDLINLKNVSFSRNGLSGSVPDSLAGLPELIHLDLSGNRFNGTVPGFLAEMEGLKYLNLEDNEFEGVLPFNGSFIRKLQVFRVGGNENLCYNRSLISEKMKLGIPQCDKYGMPVSPPPAKSTKSDSGGYDDGGSDDDDDDGDGKKSNGGRGGGHHGPKKLVLGVAIGLSCLVFLVIFLVCISKVCG